MVSGQLIRRKKLPIDFIPEGGRLLFVNQTVHQVRDHTGRVVIFEKALYKCTCGVVKELNINNVKMGKIRSCGCLQSEEAAARMTTHGLGKHPLFRVWSDMITRCENKNSLAYKYYGGIGVMVCMEWRNDFKIFYDWAINNGWGKGLKIDKDIIPKQLGIPALLYSPEMCCFVTHKDNCNYRKSSHLVTYNGKTQNVTQWEIELGFNKEIILSRLAAGWSTERAFTQPQRKSPSKKAVKW